MNIELGKFLAKLRQEKGITQEKLAEILNIDKRKISRWETGSSMPEFDMLIKLSEILDISLYELSICQKIEDKNLIEKMKIKFKSLKDYKHYSIKKRIVTFIAIIFGLFLGLSAIFSISNYRKIAIYKIYSEDDIYQIKGYIFQTPKLQFFNIGSISDDQNNNYYINTDSNYEIYNNQKRLITRSQKSFDSKFLEKKASMNENEKYYFKISILDESNEVNELTINFKIVKIYDNSLFN